MSQGCGMCDKKVFPHEVCERLVRFTRAFEEMFLEILTLWEFVSDRLVIYRTLTGVSP